MTFRLHWVVAVLLLPTLIFGQTSSTATKPPSSKPAAAPASGGPYPPMSTQAKQRAQKIFELFNSGQAGALWATFTEGTKKNYGSEQKFAEQIKRLRENLGTETKVVDEKVGPTMLSIGTLYSRLSDFAKAPGQLASTVGINEHGQVDTFLVGPERVYYQGRLGGYKDVTKLKFPFSGEWFVDQGGRAAFLNLYFRSDDMRFALDFVLVKNGRVFSGDGSDNSNYYCFGQPILAPADGQTVMVEDGFQDNPPGRPAFDSPHGNMVLISHGNSEFSLIDHLKQNSVRVKKGDKVKQGDVVAECGNSGPSTVPHIHYLLQNSGGIPIPSPLPAQFVDYYADGKQVAVGEPERGQIVSNTAPGTAQPASTK